jgi:hypothetical protein
MVPLCRLIFQARAAPALEHRDRILLLADRRSAGKYLMFSSNKSQKTDVIHRSPNQTAA